MAQVPDDVVDEFEEALNDEADKWLQEAIEEIPTVGKNKNL